MTTISIPQTTVELIDEISEQKYDGLFDREEMIILLINTAYESMGETVNQCRFPERDDSDDGHDSESDGDGHETDSPDSEGGQMTTLCGETVESGGERDIDAIPMVTMGLGTSVGDD